jgi:glycosyltransferase involved in cell wall biosynthesis
MKIKKCLTCHFGARDDYQLSLALYEMNLLKKLVTDFYTPDLLRNIIKFRYNSNLPSRMTVSNYGIVIKKYLLQNNYFLNDQRLAKSTLKYIKNNEINLFLSSYTAFEAFNFIKTNNLKNKCYLFQLHPHPISLKEIFKNESNFNDKYGHYINRELEMNQDKEINIRLDSESKLSDNCVVASSFTKRTLIENGIDEKKITIIPYGVNHNKFKTKSNYNTFNGKLNIIFVGQFIQRKGLYYLFEAIRKINSKNIKLTIAGRGPIDELLIDDYKDKINLKIKLNLTQDELTKELQNNDVFIFPSIAEGFGHVILEAMSIGLPVICTSNTAGPDLFKTGNEGFITPIRDIDALINKIIWCIDNKNSLAEMGHQSKETSKMFTWEKFRSNICEFYTENESNNG